MRPPGSPGASGPPPGALAEPIGFDGGWRGCGGRFVEPDFGKGAEPYVGKGGDHGGFCCKGGASSSDLRFARSNSDLGLGGGGRFVEPGFCKGFEPYVGKGGDCCDFGGGCWKGGGANSDPRFARSGPDLGKGGDGRGFGDFGGLCCKGGASSSEPRFGQAGPDLGKCGDWREFGGCCRKGGTGGADPRFGKSNPDFGKGGDFEGFCCKGGASCSDPRCGRSGPDLGPGGAGCHPPMDFGKGDPCAGFGVGKDSGGFCKGTDFGQKGAEIRAGGATSSSLGKGPPNVSEGACAGAGGGSSLGSLGAAEAVLLSEMGADVVKSLRQHYTALIAVADLATGNPHLRAFLRHVGQIQQRLNAAEGEVERWHSRCTSAEIELQRARADGDAVQERLAQERRRADDFRQRLEASGQAKEKAEIERQTAEDTLLLDLERCRSEALRLGAQGMAQSQALATEQAAMIASNQEIQRLRLELEVVGTMARQEASAVEVARSQAAQADLKAEHASQERVRLEAALKHATTDRHAELLSATEHATAEVARMRRKVEGGRDELTGVRKVLGSTEALLAEVYGIAPATQSAAEFLRDPDSPAAAIIKGPSLLSAGGPPPVRVPVLALRWPPGVALDTTPTIGALRAEALYGLFHQLQTGSKLPEQVELTVCCYRGHWFCAREDEAPRFAALLLYQALHRDAPIAATCRVGSVHSLLSTPPLEFTGLGVRSGPAAWRTPPLDDEDFLRAILLGSPMKELLEDFFYQRRRGRVDFVLREEAQRDPVVSVTPLPGQYRVSQGTGRVTDAPPRGAGRQRALI